MTKIKRYESSEIKHYGDCFEWCNADEVDALESSLAEMTERAEKMKCCGNCVFYRDMRPNDRSYFCFSDNNFKSRLPDDICKYWEPRSQK